jgi:hypothetical protein
MADELQTKRHHTGHAVLPHNRVARQGHRHKELMFFAGVGLSVLVILGLYAASFRYQPAFQDIKPTADWQSTKDDLISRTAYAQQTLSQIAQVKDQITAVLGAKAAQDQSIALMKNLIRSATATASATSTTH